MKRVILILLPLIILFTLCMGSAYGEGASLTLDSCEAEPGAEISVPIRIAGNPGIISIEFDVVYDREVLEWTGVQAGDYGTIGDYELGVGQSVAWFSKDERTDIVQDGVFVTLSFIIKEGTEAKTTQIGINYDEDNIFNAAYSNVTFAVVPGSVTVTGSEPAPDPARISGLGAEFSDAMTLKFYVKDVPATVSPVFEVVLNDDNRTLAQAADSAAFALSNNPVYTAAWDEASSRWEIRVKVFGKWLSSAYTLRMYDGSTAGDPLPLKGYAYGGIGDSSVATEHAYTMLDYCDVMRTWKAGDAAYAELYNAVSVYGGTMAQYWR